MGLEGFAGGAGVSIVIKGVDAFSNTFKGAGKGLEIIATKAKAAGGVITAFGVAAAAGFGIAIKKASDFEEINSKFGTVFQDVSKEAENVAGNLAKNYGLSNKASKELLSSTGDLLTGFGFTGKAALDISEEVNELAVDLASFTNAQGGAEAVSNALTKSLLGERESLKTYGIAILDADVKQRVLENGQQNLSDEALRQAKAYATLQLAIEQSKNAVGDFERTQDSFANQTKVLNAQFENLSVEVGDVLLPLFTDMLGLFNDLFSGLNEMNPEVKKWAVIIGAAAVAIALIVGPLLLFVGIMAPAIPIIAGAAVAMGGLVAASLPLLPWILAFLAALAVGIVLFGNWGKFMKGVGIRIETFKLGIQKFAIDAGIAFIGLKIKVMETMNSIINSIGPMVNTAIGYVNNLIDAFNAASGAFGFTVENIAEFNIEALKFDTSDATSQVEKLSAASRDLDWDINKLKTTIPKAGSFKDEFLSGLGNITGIGNNKSPVVPSTGSNNQVNIQIDQVNGADPEEMSAAIRTVLADQISFN